MGIRWIVEGMMNCPHCHKPISDALIIAQRNKLAAKKERPESVFVITYEALVGNLELSMRALSAWLGIEWDSLLLQPTFNRLPTVPNSSYRMLETGVRPESLDRWREALDAGVLARIEAEALELDAAVRSIADVA